MNLSILKPEVQRYLHGNDQAKPSELALRKSPFAEVAARELAQQLDGRQRCRKKLPLWYHTTGIYYPEKLSVEQASSQTTAHYKALLLPEQARVIDLTGGFGVDTFFFAQRAEAVVHCEKNESLSRIAQHNASVLGAANIEFIASDGLARLESYSNDAFDAIYIDPSRRVEKRKVFRLEDCVPDVVNIQHCLLQKARQVLVKSAPLLDITAALLVLKNVCEVHIVSIANECKELLFILDRTYKGSPRLVAAALKADGITSFAFTDGEEKTAVSEFGYPAGYLYEPDAALLKSGAFKLIGQRYGLKKLHQHTHLYTALELNSDFMGKVFRITNIMRYGDFKKNNTTVQGNVSTRNFPLKAEELRKRHRISEGGDDHLFFCTGIGDELLVIFASKCGFPLVLESGNPVLCGYV